jgi:hypothetical protein
MINWIQGQVAIQPTAFFVLREMFEDFIQQRQVKQLKGDGITSPDKNDDPK